VVFIVVIDARETAELLLGFGHRRQRMLDPAVEPGTDLSSLSHRLLQQPEPNAILDNRIGLVRGLPERLHVGPATSEEVWIVSDLGIEPLGQDGRTWLAWWRRSGADRRSSSSAIPTFDLIGTRSLQPLHSSAGVDFLLPWTL